ncbi:class I SAM-dependent methyltransferase [bacterium]|nr:class I SAM-dependent methyltransferase [bacterium]
MEKLYPDSKVEVHGFEAKFYDFLLNLISFGIYGKFIKKAIGKMDISPSDKILDLGCGSGKNDLLMRKYLNEGFIVGLDIGDDMIKVFKKRTKNINNIDLIKNRIDKSFNIYKNNGTYTLENNEDKILFNKAFISFVIHGLPQESRLEVIKNAYNNLETGGKFFILDYTQRPLKENPRSFQILFKKVECKYAFDYIERDIEKDLKDIGFTDIQKKTFFKGSINLLSGLKK